jgi:hypothetical protein
MQFRTKKLFSLISLSIIGLILFCNLTVNAQTTAQTENSLSRCSISPMEQIKITNKDGKESIENRQIPLSLANVIKDNNGLGEVREVSLGDRIKVNVNGLSKAIKKDSQFDPNQLVLQLNGYTLKNIRGTYLEPDQLIFELAHQEVSSNEWNAILGAVWNEKRTVLVTVGCPDGQRIQFKDPKDLRNSTLTILLWDSARRYIILIPIGLLLFVVFTKEFRDALRGSGITSNRVFSLGRFQLAWWSYLILFSFLGLYAVTGSYQNIITSQSMTLLGISTATTVGSSVIDSSGEDRQIDPDVENSLKDLDDKFNSWKNFDGAKRIKKINVQIKSIKTQIKNLGGLMSQTQEGKVKPNGSDDSESQKRPDTDNLQKTKLLNDEDELSKKRVILKNMASSRDRELRKLKAEMNGMEQQSENFFKDILTNPSGEINLHRYQIFIWTIVLGGIFIYQVLTSFKMPEFDANLLTLQGISSVTFLALKSQEKPLKGGQEKAMTKEFTDFPKTDLEEISLNETMGTNDPTK